MHFSLPSPWSLLARRLKRPRASHVVAIVMLALLAAPASVTAQPFELSLASPALDRWMYPHNATPGSRPTAPVFGTLGDESGVDSRHGQFLIGFDLTNGVAPHLGPSRYLLRRCRLSLTVSRDQSFVLDPTPDDPATYLPSGHPEGVPDADAGRPIELFGVGYRNGFIAETFVEDAPFGSPAMGERNAYAAGFDARGVLIDVGNNVGKTNAAFPNFEVVPFAVGTSSMVAPGDIVPAGTVIDFELNLEDPLVAGYLQAACHTGRLRFLLTSLQTSGFGGQPAWAEFHTRESVLGNPPSLVLSGTAVRSEDSDGDHLPDDWERHFFGALAGSAFDDSDRDGLVDPAEWEAGTHPLRAGETLAVSVTLAPEGNSSRLRFRASPSRRYDLMASRDLHTWEVVAEATLQHDLGSPWATFTILSAGSSDPRFFRVKATPIAVTQP